MPPRLPDFSLSLEQEFDIQKFRRCLGDLPREELEALFIDVMRQKMSFENLSRGLIRSF